MGEAEFDPSREGKKIASSYLSKRGWARQRRISLNSQLNPAFDREVFEVRERDCDRMDEEAEGYINDEVERWRNDRSPQAKGVLRAIYEALGKRTDLGFFAKQIVGHLQRTFTPL